MFDKATTQIFLIDDDEFVLKVLHHGLANFGYQQLISCSDAVEALELIGNSRIPVKVVVCDLNMPRIDGVDFLRRLWETGYEGYIVLISGEDSRLLKAAEHLAQQYQLNILGILEKPVFPKALSHILDRRISTIEALPTSTEIGFSPSELGAAINNGEIICYYQPQADMATGRIVGVEALARWRHPQLGIIEPDIFIPIAEAQGLLDSLTFTVLEFALRDAVNWQKSGINLTLSVNIFVDNIFHPHFAEKVFEILQSVGLEPKQLTLEITEGRIMKSLSVALNVLTRLRLHGIGVAIDDFGTGYSSLVQLKELPFSELKIDRRFVHDATTDKTALIIVDSSVRLGRMMDIKVIAEGVESRQEWDMISAYGCDGAQGYFIAQAMPGETLLPWLKAYCPPAP